MSRLCLWLAAFSITSHIVRHLSDLLFLYMHNKLLSGKEL